MLELIASGAACLLLDQWSKRAVARRGGGKENRKAHVTAPAMLLVWIAALASAVVLVEWGVWFQSSAAQFGLAAAFGGAAGNLLDMIRRRSILDFIDLRWWPCFNLADVAIVCGLAVAFWRG